MESQDFYSAYKTAEKPLFFFMRINFVVFRKTSGLLKLFSIQSIGL